MITVTIEIITEKQLKTKTKKNSRKQHQKTD